MAKNHLSQMRNSKRNKFYFIPNNRPNLLNKANQLFAKKKYKNTKIKTKQKLVITLAYLKLKGGKKT